MRPNLDGANFGFAHRIGQAAKADATRSEGCTPKGLQSRSEVGNPMALGMIQQVMVRQQVHGKIAAKRGVAEPAAA